MFRTPHTAASALLLVLAFAFALGCADAGGAGALPARDESAAAAVRARAWPEADALFRRDPTWLGADAAVSVALDQERVLWLFGDSFIATQPAAAAAPAAARTRAGARMVRNSVGLQIGLDPSRAALEFFVGRAADAGPGSYFAEQDHAWFWPGSGVYLDGVLTLFLQRVRADATPGGLGFRSAGWAAVRVRDPRGPPGDWSIESLATPDTGEVGLVGVAVLVEGAFVYAYGVREPGDHALFLLRWSRDAFASGDLSAPEFHGGTAPALRGGASGGTARGFGVGQGVAVIAQGATEFSVSPAVHGGYVQVQSHGFGPAPIALRFAPALHGPWSAPLEVFRPEEAARPNVLLYAARAHPEQRAGGDLVLTYASNTLDANALLGDLSLYFPRFVRVSY